MHDTALKKELGLFSVFCIASGAMISSGLFILPGLAFAEAGPAMIVSYIIAGLLCIPTVLSMAELTTAMPKAGGDYFYIMKGFGPLLGTMAGMSSWFALSFKGAFALIGVGTFLNITLSFPVPIKFIAITFCFIFIIVNLLGIREASTLQIVLVLFMFLILGLYVIFALPNIEQEHFSPFWGKNIGKIFSTASFVFVSYGGLIKISALAEEVKEPKRTLVGGMLLALITIVLIYTLVTFAVVGTVNPVELKGSLTAVFDSARTTGGKKLEILVGIAGMLAFVTTANAAIMSGARYPVGMSRDKILPPLFKKVSSRFGTPCFSVFFTGTLMIIAIYFLPLDFLVKIASGTLILLYILGNFTLILFRISNISTYRPKFYSPLYPYIQIVGILGGFFLLVDLGTKIIICITLGLFICFIWYKLYVAVRTSKDSVLIYALERLIAKDKELLSDNILVELKDIVIERDAVIKDSFHKLIEDSIVVDEDNIMEYEEAFRKVSSKIAEKIGLNKDELFKKFVEREKESSTVIKKGVAIPHIIVDGDGIFNVCIMRAKKGAIFPDDEVVHAIFCIVSSKDQRNLHLKVLSAIAQIISDSNFDKMWKSAYNAEDLKNFVLLADRTMLI